MFELLVHKESPPCSLHHDFKTTLQTVEYTLMYVQGESPETSHLNNFYNF